MASQTQTGFIKRTSKRLAKQAENFFRTSFCDYSLKFWVAKIAVFSTMKYINSPNFSKFREIFKAEYKKGFVCLGSTFDNVAGNFPIGFLIWDTANKQEINKIECDVWEVDGKK